MNSREMDKCLNVKSCQQIIHFSTFASLLSINKHLSNNKNFVTEVRKRQKYDTNKSRTRRIRETKNKNSKRDTNYDILGIDSKATQKQIKSAYYERSKLCHPDLNQSTEAGHEFRRITDAYEVLANEKTKKVYDLNTFGSEQRYNDLYEEIHVNHINEKTNKVDDEDYTQFWRNRIKTRNININLKHKFTKNNDNQQSDDKQNYNYKQRRDAFDSETFKEFFSEEYQRKYSEKLKEKEKVMREVMHNSHNEGLAVLTAMLTIITFLAAFQLINVAFGLDKPPDKKHVSHGRQTEVNSDNTSTNR